VGGVVRDILAGLPSKDTDVVTSATPEQIQEIFKTHDVKTVGKSFGVVLVDGIEVATFRHDRYGGLNSRQCLVSFVSSIEEDLARRDFTINSMAFCEFTGDLIDLFGGKGDLENKIIRFVGNPKDRIYEDPNRIVRACRFLAKIDGQFDCETYEALCAHAHYVKDHVAGERIRLEILKALELPRPSLFFRALFEIGVLDYIFPSMIPCVGHHHGKHHREEIFTHLMIVGDHISPKFPLLRLAGYLHDVGKPISYTEDGKFLGHEIAGAEIITRELQVLRFSNEEIAKISNLVKVHMNSYLGCSQKALRRLLRRFFEENVTFHEFLRLRITDCIGNLYKPNLEIGEIKTILYKYKEAIKEKSPTGIQMLAINGHEIMGVLGIPPGPKLGKS
jgi:tRNA nucleotidyltransferase/poly(A) polymerase